MTGTHLVQRLVLALTICHRYHYPSPSSLTPEDPFPKADATLINGKGRYPTGGPADLSVVNVEYGKRYRLRIVSISCDPSYTFSIDDHPLTVIEADGESVVPVRRIDALQIYAGNHLLTFGCVYWNSRNYQGQRYSVVLVANQPIGNYWIRSLPAVDDGDPLGTFEGGLNSAILRYKGAKRIDPRTTDLTQPNVLLETQLHALIDPAAPGKPIRDGGDVNLDFNFTMNATRWFAINGTTFVPPKVPVLLQILTGTPPHELLPNGSVYTLPRNKSISISIPGEITNTDGPVCFFFSQLFLDNT